MQRERILVTFQREKDDAIKRDRHRIEGTWLVTSLEMSGNKALDEDARKLKVVIGADDSWNVTSEGNQVNQGTCTIDPLKSPKTIDSSLSTTGMSTLAGICDSVAEMLATPDPTDSVTDDWLKAGTLSKVDASPGDT